MAVVHLFVSTGLFSSFAEMRRFIDEAYTEDGDGIASAFMSETGLEDYQTACIEAYCVGKPVDLASLLVGASYADQWGQGLPKTLTADSAICVFEPNTLRTPRS